MKLIKESKNGARWPRKAYKNVECRKRDLVVRITDWTTDRDEPGYDVEVYIGGVYDFNESQTFTLWTAEGGPLSQSKTQAKLEAVTFAQAQIAKLL